ncbi:hypothetical protein CVT25_001641 [Psilocybe cyanescens]|uniref:Uncharacterized protein n=1 Tax=Psilocybe cyanescens TaxID=93625 RepID=A0A409W046_PSICY|nr:hypothetical protein CVT25_001641 [Psilocybe cyanescens]
MPRVGNQAFANYVDAHLALTHINNKEDIAPIVPGRFLGYHHPSGEVHIMDNNQWVSCPGIHTADIRRMDSIKHDQHASHTEETPERPIEGSQKSESQGVRDKESKPIIHRLPFEVIGYMFKFYVDDAKNLHKHSNAPFRLGAVCRTWRHIAWRTPSLWTSLFCRLDENTTEGQIQLAVEWLSRSGQLPLSISLYNASHQRREPYAAIPLINVINQSLNRCLHLDLQWFTSFMFSRLSQIKEASMLKTLQVYRRPSEYSSPLDLGPLVSPMELNISHVQLKSLAMNWNNLTHFRTSSVFVDDMLHALTLAPQMTTFHLFKVVIPRSTRPDRLRKVLHSQLEDLSFELYSEEGNNGALAGFFQSTTFPNLTICKVETLRNFPTIAFLAFLSRSSCSITDFSFNDGSISGEDLVQIAQALPSVTSLNIFRPNSRSRTLDGPLSLGYFYKSLCQDSRYRTILPGEVVLLPLLQRLSIRTTDSFSWEWLSGFHFRYQYDSNTPTISTCRLDLESITICCQRFIIYGTPYLPVALIHDWQTFSELIELNTKVSLHLEVEIEDRSNADLFELSYKRLQITHGAAPEHIQESHFAESQDT